MNGETAADIRRFLERVPIDRANLVFDGCGPNGAVQYEVLSLLGVERLLAAQTVHVMSSSSFAYLFFLARHRGQLALGRDQICGWDAIIRRNHGVVPGLTLIRALGRFARGKSAEIPAEGLERSFREVVTDAFAAQTVADLPPNVRFWLYNETRRELMAASADSPLSAMPLPTLVKAAAAVPRVFTEVSWQGERFVDPIYSPGRRELYRTLRSDGDVLVSNVFRRGEQGNAMYVRPTGRLSGQPMLLKDFGLFLSGLPNPALAAAVDEGLFGTAAL